jgi:hypothetical protein
MVRGKRVLLFSILASFLFLITSSSGWAYPFEVGDVITLNNGPGTTNGGEFIIKENGTVIHNTFCLEKNETFSFGQSLTIKGISDFAEAGGGGAMNGRDYLSDETRYLYYHYFIGDLQNYDYSDSVLRVQDANALQLAIWYLEEELFEFTATANFDPYYNEYTRLAHEQIIAGNTAGIDRVKVLNLTKNGGAGSQDQLTVVPEPGTLLSLGIFLLGLGGVTRRRFKR